MGKKSNKELRGTKSHGDYGVPDDIKKLRAEFVRPRKEEDFKNSRYGGGNRYRRNV